MRAIAFLVAACCGLSAGCGKPFNEQIDLKGIDPLPALSQHADPTPLSGTPSLRGFDRRHWPAVTVAVPVRQTDHYPSYAGNLKLSGDGGPWDGRFPTAVQALDDGADPGADALEGLIEPAYAAGLLLYSPIAMVIHPPWSMRRSPDEPYDRLPPTATEGIQRWIIDSPRRVEWNE
jgi:hypothetical protein